MIFIVEMILMKWMNAYVSNLEFVLFLSLHFFVSFPFIYSFIVNIGNQSTAKAITYTIRFLYFVLSYRYSLFGDDIVVIATEYFSKGHTRRLS